jgi:hypothetical protein
MLQAHQEILLRPLRPVNLNAKVLGNLNVVRMQSSNDIWNSWVVHLYLVNRIRQR